MADTPETATASPDVIAAEMARRQALSAMGITVYSSRFDFPGAAKAQRFAVPAPELNEPVVVSRSVEPRIETHSPPVPQMPQATSGGPAADVPVSQSRAAESSSGSESVSFSMLLASAGPFLWLEELGDGLIRQDQLALINAMARAISTPTTTLMQQQFDWPVAGNSALSGDAESAKQALHGLIQRMARKDDAKRVILMGDCHYLPDRIVQSGVRIPSTLAMLSEPSLKRVAWEALKPLKSLSLG
ncbi:MAG: hypothetical protein VXW93_04785 [Pseudomonadota bacterium]|nr:hypothetical protein [Pseudomonadota bacterium]